MFPLRVVDVNVDNEGADDVLNVDEDDSEGAGDVLDVDEDDDRLDP